MSRGTLAAAAAAAGVRVGVVFFLAARVAQRPVLVVPVLFSFFVPSAPAAPGHPT